MSTNANQFHFTQPDTLTGTSGVLEGITESKGTIQVTDKNGEVTERTLGVDLANQEFVILVRMPFPKTEENIGARLGKRPKLKDAEGKIMKDAAGKPILGEAPVTTRTYGKVSPSPVYIQGDGQLMVFNAKLNAPVAGVEQATEDDDDDDA